MNPRDKYPKKILSFDEQVERLSQRGLIIDDLEEAKSFLNNVSYFSLQGFWWEFQSNKRNHHFKEGINFKDVINLYTFDRQFRILLFDAIERIEIALRTKLIYYPSIEIDQWWFDNPKNFLNAKFHSEVFQEIEKELHRTKEVFIESHFDNYGSELMPPAYKTLEVVSFGCLSKLYSNLDSKYKAKNIIAQEFNLPNYTYLKSWLKTFNIIRNIVAHHSRLCNRNIDSPPSLLKSPKYDFIEIPINDRSMYHCLSCIIYALNKVSPGHSLKERFIELLDESTFIPFSEMGFPRNWREQNLWL